MALTDSNETAFHIRHSNTVGRYAVSHLNFNSGDELFSEKPFAIGPKPDGPPVCLGCHIPVDCLTLCSSCNWPVCGKMCEASIIHKEAECVIFAKAKVSFQGRKIPCLQYECIMPIRVLLAMLRNYNRWNSEVNMMESHNSLRSTKSIWKFNQINIVNYLRGPCKLSIFTEELIHKVCGILECNAFEARAKCGFPIRCLYPKLGVLSHNCISNTAHSIESDNFTVTVRASIAINKSEELFSSYTYALWPTLVRREFLLDSKYFECMCKRCSDPTEMGTNMSSLLCNNCNNGILTCASPLENGIWGCSFCQNYKTYEEVKTLFTAIQTEIEQNLNEELLVKYKNILHANNAYFVIIKASLIPHYRKRKLYDTAVQFSQDVIQILNIIQPGYTRMRGTTLYEIFLNTILPAFENGENFSTRKHKVDEALYALEECATILKLESNATQEGELGKKADYQLTQLRQSYDDIIEGKCNVCSIIN